MIFLAMAIKTGAYSEGQRRFAPMPILVVL